MMRSRVVLPEPLSPRMVRNSPSATCSEMSRSTGVFPNDLATLRISSREVVAVCIASVVAGWPSVATLSVMDRSYVAPAPRRLSREHLALEVAGESPDGPMAIYAPLLRCLHLVPYLIVFGAARHVLP